MIRQRVFSEVEGRSQWSRLRSCTMVLQTVHNCFRPHQKKLPGCCFMMLCSSWMETFSKWTSCRAGLNNGSVLQGVFQMGAWTCLASHQKALSTSAACSCASVTLRPFLWTVAISTSVSILTWRFGCQSCAQASHELALFAALWPVPITALHLGLKLRKQIQCMTKQYWLLYEKQWNIRYVQTSHICLPPKVMCRGGLVSGHDFSPQWPGLEWQFGIFPLMPWIHSVMVWSRSSASSSWTSHRWEEGESRDGLDILVAAVMQIVVIPGCFLNSCHNERPVLLEFWLGKQKLRYLTWARPARPKHCKKGNDLGSRMFVCERRSLQPSFMSVGP